MKYTGIVINSNTYKDNDLIVELLTENEIITFRSKGIKKKDSKNRSLIFDFAFIEAEFFKKGEKTTLINGKNLLNLSHLYSSFEGLVFISFIKEVLFKLVVDEDKILIYKELQKSLTEIANSEQKRVILNNLTHLLIKIGEIAGYGPLNYYQETNFYDAINDFYLMSENIDKYEEIQVLRIIKKLGYYLEETSDIKLDTILLLQHL